MSELIQEMSTAAAALLGHLQILAACYMLVFLVIAMPASILGMATPSSSQLDRLRHQMKFIKWHVRWLVFIGWVIMDSYRRLSELYRRELKSNKRHTLWVTFLVWTFITIYPYVLYNRFMA